MRAKWICHLQALGVRGGLALLAAISLGGPLLAQAQQDEGSPILVIESYTTNPAPAVSGQSFTFTATVRNTGTKHAEQIFASVAGGSSFVGLDAPAAIGLLDPDMSATFSLKIQAPEGLSTGAYDLPVDFLYRIGSSGAYEIVRTVGVQVTGAAKAVKGKPQMVIESATVVAPPASVGEAFGVQLILRNAGTRKAIGVTVALKLNETLSPAEGSGTTTLGDIAVNQVITSTLTMNLDKLSASGRVLQTVSLDYTDPDNVKYTQEETVGLEVGLASGRKMPQLIVAGYATSPARPVPGAPFTLNLQVTNVGAGDARRVLLRLGEEGSLEPFAPIGTSNVRFVPEIVAGATAAISQTLIADGSAKGGAYRLKVGLTYETTLDETKTESETISLLVLTPPQLKVSLFEMATEPLMVSQSFDIPVEVVNIGRQTVNISTVEVTSPDLELTEASLYLGPLDAGTSGSLTAVALPKTAGTATATVTVHYLDDFNQDQTFTQALTFAIEAPPPSEAAPVAKAEPGALEKVWQAILGFFGLGG